MHGYGDINREDLLKNKDLNLETSPDRQLALGGQSPPRRRLISWRRADCLEWGGFGIQV